MSNRITMGVQIPPALYEQLTQAAKQAGVSKSVIIRWAVADYVEFILKGGEIFNGEEDRSETTRGNINS